MGDIKDWYQVLQISEQATDEMIKAAYRKLVKKCHPDAHPGDQECEERFRTVSEAYRILSDPERRRAYDEESSKGAEIRKNIGGESDISCRAGGFSERISTI